MYFLVFFPRTKRGAARVNARPCGRMALYVCTSMVHRLHTYRHTYKSPRLYVCRRVCSSPGSKTWAEDFLRLPGSEAGRAGWLVPAKIRPLTFRPLSVRSVVPSFCHFCPVLSTTDRLRRVLRYPQGWIGLDSRHARSEWKGLGLGAWGEDRSREVWIVLALGER